MTRTLPARVPGPPGSRILAVGGYRPRRVVGNDEVCRRIDSTDAWIRERSGIVTRHVADADETVVEMAAAASRQALERAGVATADVDVVLVATTTHPHALPSAATAVAHQIGAGPAAASDVAAACAGFCHALALADSLVRSGTARHVLVAGSERMTDVVDPEDRGTAFLFGDGAGAVLVGPSERPGIAPTVWGSDGSQWDVIRTTPSWTEARDGEPGRGPFMTMAGQTVFRWAVWQMAPVAAKALDAAGITADDLAAFVPHQANLRIVDAMVKRLALPASVAVARDVVDAANTSAASVPLAMDRMLTSGEAPSGGLALLIGFGAGLAYAAQVVELP